MKPQPQKKKPIRQKETKTAVISPFSKYLPYIILAAILLFSVLIRISFLNMPFERDEGSYSMYGKLLLQGKIPYIGFYEQKLPGLFYAYSIIVFLFGPTVKGMHLGFIFISLGTTLCVFFIARRLFDHLTALISSASFSIMSLSPQASGFTVQSEHMVALCAMGGILLMVIAMSKPRWWLFMLSGVLMGFAVLIKQSAVFLGIFAGIAIILYHVLNKPVDWKKLILQIIYYSAGVFMIILIFLMFIIKQGSYKDMVYWAFKFAAEYVGQIPFSDGINLFKYFSKAVTDGYMVFWIASILGAVFLGFIKTDRFHKLFMWLMLAAGFLTIVPGMRFYGHYWQQFIPVMAILVGVAFFSINQFFIGVMKSAKAVYLTSVVFLLIFISDLSAHSSYYFTPDYTRILKDVYTINPFPEAKVVGDYLREHAGKDDKLAVLGSEPEIYFYSGLESASRHIYLNFLVGDSTVFPESRQLQNEFVKDVETGKPEYMVYIKNDLSWLITKKSVKIIDKWFNKFATKNYDLIGIGDIISKDKTVFKWNEDINQYRPSGENMIGVFRRKKVK
ncbi:MAG: glycosyltransferase family 39 protein [Bacteroidia bacterium]|nr:glycosyltransferase family 39 protein [Bacteroidia bacterium]